MRATYRDEDGVPGKKIWKGKLKGSGDKGTLKEGYSYR